MSKVSRLHMLCSMANSGCMLLSGSGMLPHSLQCSPAFLYLPQVRKKPSHCLCSRLFIFFLYFLYYFFLSPRDLFFHWSFSTLLFCLISVAANHLTSSTHPLLCIFAFIPTTRLISSEKFHFNQQFFTLP